MASAAVGPPGPNSKPPIMTDVVQLWHGQMHVLTPGMVPFHEFDFGDDVGGEVGGSQQGHVVGGGPEDHKFLHTILSAQLLH